ncbi:TlpA family protein disulfide reductase [Arsenicibacter rosenii]|nr:TlpA disulfide reductase family protein [Arsenicibacter rosenii]
MSQKTIQNKSKVIKVPLFVEKGKGPFYFTIRGIQPLKDTLNEHISGIPEDLDTVVLWRLNFGRSQANYHLYRSGGISLKSYQNLINRFKLDTSQNNVNYKSYSFVFSGIKGNKYYFGFDTNLNQSFSDEITFSCDTSLSINRFHQAPDSLISIPIEFEIMNHGKIERRKKNMNIIIGNRSYRYANKKLASLHIPVGLNEHKKGHFTINKDNYQVALSSAYEDDQLADIVISTSLTNKYISEGNPLFIVGDSLVLNNHILKIDSLSLWTDTLYLSITPYQKPLIGFRTGNTAPSFKMPNDIFGKKINNEHKKYTLLDFWGTWCVPCIKAIPELREIKKQYGDRLNIVSISYENTEDTTKVARLIREQRMDWFHLLETSKKESVLSLVKLLRIESFPTTILIDANNKILMRKIGIAGVKEEIEKLLSQK